MNFALSQGKKGTNFPMTDWGLFANSVMRGRVHARRTQKGLSCGFEAQLFHHQLLDSNEIRQLRDVCIFEVNGVV